MTGQTFGCQCVYFLPVGGEMGFNTAVLYVTKDCLYEVRCHSVTLWHPWPIRALGVSNLVPKSLKTIVRKPVTYNLSCDQNWKNNWCIHQQKIIVMFYLNLITKSDVTIWNWKFWIHFSFLHTKKKKKTIHHFQNSLFQKEIMDFFKDLN